MNIGQALRELDLRAGATEEEIRRAYRTLVAKWHPDKHQNDPIRLSEAELRIKNINRAFEKLQSVKFQTKKTTGKKDNTAEKNADTKKKSENGNKKQKADGKRNNPNQRTDSANSTKTAKRPTSKKQWYSHLVVGFLGAALGYLANGMTAPPNPPPQPDPIGKSKKDENKNDIINENKKLRQVNEEITSQKNSIDEQYRSLLISMEKKQSELMNLKDLSQNYVQANELLVNEKKQSDKKIAELEEVVKESFDSLDDDSKFQLITNSLAPPTNNALSSKLVELYFPELNTGTQDKLLSDCYEDCFGFSAEYMKSVLSRKPKKGFINKVKWQWYWDGLNGGKKNERESLHEFDFGSDNALKWILPQNPTKKCLKECQQNKNGNPAVLRLRWVLQIYDEHQFFPVVDSDMPKKGNNSRRQTPFGPFPEFRGLFLSKKGAVTRDRAVGLKIQ